MGIGVLKAVVNGPGSAVTLGMAGSTVIFTGPEVVDDPPGPFARYVKEPVPVNPAVGVKVTELPATDVVPLVVVITVMLVETPLMLAVRLIGAAGVLNAVWNGPAGTDTVGGGGSVVRLMVTFTSAELVPQGPVAW